MEGRGGAGRDGTGGPSEVDLEHFVFNLDPACMCVANAADIHKRIAYR